MENQWSIWESFISLNGPTALQALYLCASFQQLRFAKPSTRLSTCGTAHSQLQSAHALCKQVHTSTKRTTGYTFCTQYGILL